MKTIIALWIIMFIICITVGIVVLIVALATKGNSKNRNTVQPIQKPIQMPMQQPISNTYTQPIRNEINYIYQRKNLLTKNEYVFYKHLKEFAEKYNLHVLAKIRIADIVEPRQNRNKSEWYSSFGKIKSKHVDFAIANKENLYILCLIELDDNSHKKADRIERDKFIDNVYTQAGIPILHTQYFNEQTEKILCNILGLQTKSVSSESQVPSANVN